MPRLLPWDLLVLILITTASFGVSVYKMAYEERAEVLSIGDASNKPTVAEAVSP